MESALTTKLLNRLKGLDGVDAIEYLELTNCLVVPKEVKTLAECIREFQDRHRTVCPLLTIDLMGNLICGLDEYGDGDYDVSGLALLIEVLMESADRNPIRKVNFCRNNVGANGCAAISKLFGKTSPNFLVEINLRSCGIDTQGLKALLSGFDNGCKVTHLDLRQNNFGSVEGMEALGDCLERNASIKHFDMSHVHIATKGLEVFFERLAHNGTLQILSMIDCRIGDKGARALSQFIKVNVALQYLDIQENGIGDAGMDDLSKGLNKTSSLIMLGLQFNDITDAGVTLLGAGLRPNISVRTLYLYGNKITVNGMQEFLRELQGRDKNIVHDFPIKAY